MDITRRIPPLVRQTFTDSCWAAVLESWSRAVTWFPDQWQQHLCDKWGEGPTRGITPAAKIPVIASAFGLRHGGFAAADLSGYVKTHLPHGYVFCAFTNGALTHAVLIYRLSGRGNVSFMDPDGGRDRSLPMAELVRRGPFVLLRHPTPADP